MSFKKILGSVEEYVMDFAKDESGMELLQFAIVVVITVGLMAAVFKIQDNTNQGLEDSAEQIKDGFDDTLNNHGYNGGSGGTN